MKKIFVLYILFTASSAFGATNDYYNKTIILKYMQSYADDNRSESNLQDIIPLTNRLVKAINNANQKVADIDCGGKFIEGELCGLDYDPITCAQDYDIPEIVSYKPALYHDNIYLVRARWGKNWPINDYRYIKKDGKLFLDGIKCDLRKFNW